MVKKLWAPWRIDYVIQKKPRECILCEKPAARDDKSNLILYRGKNCFVMMNLFPYNNGHLLISPYRHISEFTELSELEQLELMQQTALSIKALRNCMNPQGFNVGLNLGKEAGAGIEEHLHFHIVPRWTGDTNFMPVIGSTKVLVEGLQETWERLKVEFEKLT